MASVAFRSVGSGLRSRLPFVVADAARLSLLPAVSPTSGLGPAL
jgi:hypothetical protein